MCRYFFSSSLISLLFPAILLFSGAAASQAAADTASTLEGWFSILHGDGQPGSGLTAEIYTLTTLDEETSVLLFDKELARPFGGINALNRKFISVQTTLSALGIANSGDPVFQVSSLKVIDLSQQRATESAMDASASVSGAKPWVTIMCKFSDIGDEPENLVYFQNMYGNSKPGFDHYWREVSYNNVSLAGSAAAGWFVLPHPESYYNETDTKGGADRTRLFTDCTAAADSSVDFSSFSGINMMFNSNFDNGYAWGGSKYATLDGVSKSFYVTWEPPWGYQDIAVIAHEMGHGFGLPHSSGMYGEIYDNDWDIMSDSWANCNNSRDATYGCLGQHTIAYHKDMLGWIPAGDIYVANGQDVTLFLDNLYLASPTNYRMIKLPLNGSSSNFITVEVRQKYGYDVKLPGEGVIIHEVDVFRSRHANVIDEDGDGDTGDEGAIFSVGESYINLDEGFSVNVLSQTASGYKVFVSYGGFPWNLFFPALLRGE